jgi:hypothetical protein
MKVMAKDKNSISQLPAQDCSNEKQGHFVS